MAKVQSAATQLQGVSCRYMVFEEIVSGVFASGLGGPRSKWIVLPYGARMGRAYNLVRRVCRTYSVASWIRALPEKLNELMGASIADPGHLSGTPRTWTRTGWPLEKDCRERK